MCGYWDLKGYHRLDQQPLHCVGKQGGSKDWTQESDGNAAYAQQCSVLNGILLLSA